MILFITIFLLLLIAYSLLINYYHRGWLRIPEFTLRKVESVGVTSFPVAENDSAIRVSVVVAARNEEQVIDHVLDSILSQEYSGWFEVICIDDHSTDFTLEKISNYASRDRRIRILRLAEGIEGKKKCIEAGIRVSAGSHIVTTDADCRLPPLWLATIAAFFKQHSAKFVAGPVNMIAPSGLAGIFQRLDFITMQGITGASVFMGLHPMCNGANLAYEKSAFIEVDGFAGIDQIPSGDDMLLMHKIASVHPGKIYYLKSKDAIATTTAEPNWQKFLSQRIRWASKATHYKDQTTFYILLLTYLVNMCFLTLAIVLIFDWQWWWIFSLFLLMKILVEFPFVHTVAAFFGQRSIMVYFPFLQPLHIIYVVVSGWLGRFGSYEWKGRLIKNKQRTNVSKQ